jgi:hypothetical protein
LKPSFVKRYGATQPDAQKVVFSLNTALSAIRDHFASSSFLDVT